MTLVGIGIVMVSSGFSFADSSSQKNELKKQIIALAQSFEGQGDPDFSKQAALEPLVQQLLVVADS